MEPSSQTESQPRSGQQIKAADLANRRDELDFAIEKSIRYRARRQAHYELIHRALMFSVIFFGSAAFGNLFESPKLLGLLAALFAAFDLVWSFSTSARDHYFLRMRFSGLAADIRGSEPTEQLITEWARRRLDIEKDEGPIYWAVEKSCYNEVREAWGWTKKDKCKIDRTEYWLMNWVRFERVD